MNQRYHGYDCNVVRLGPYIGNRRVRFHPHRDDGWHMRFVGNPPKDGDFYGTRGGTPEPYDGPFNDGYLKTQEGIEYHNTKVVYLIE
jgi:hypothetical protein